MYTLFMYSIYNEDLQFDFLGVFDIYLAVSKTGFSSPCHAQLGSASHKTRPFETLKQVRVTEEGKFKT